MPEEDHLILGGEQPTGEEAEYYEEEINLHEEIASACNALTAIAEIDEAILPANRKRMVRTIRRKALEIIHRNVIDIHAEVFGRTEEEEESEDED